MKLWQEVVRIRHQCERISNIPSCDWRAYKNWFFMLTTFFAPAFFSIDEIWRKIEKWPEPKFFFYPKISYVMSVNHAKEFLKHVLYFLTFLLEFKWPPVFQFWELMSKNEILRTISCIYFMKIWVNKDFRWTGCALLPNL